jgi:hypothetical protein
MRIIGERQLHVHRRRGAHHSLEGEALGGRACVGLADERVPRTSEVPTLLAQEGDERIGGACSRWCDVAAERG